MKKNVCFLYPLLYKEGAFLVVGGGGGRWWGSRSKKDVKNILTFLLKT